MVRSGPTSLRITGIPNARVSAPLAALRALHARSPADRLGEIAVGPPRGSIPKTCAYSTRTMRWPSSGPPQDRDISMPFSGPRKRTEAVGRDGGHCGNERKAASPTADLSTYANRPAFRARRWSQSRARHCDSICAAHCRST